MNNQNEARADRAHRIVDLHSDRNFETDGVDGLATDIGDVISDLLHLGERFGIEAQELLDRGERHWEGDSEDGPRVARREWSR
jgi:hypothetical protein